MRACDACSAHCVLPFALRLAPARVCPCECVCRFPIIEGATALKDRQLYIDAFKEEGGAVNTLFLSRVGDVALDVPDANVIIQISSHFGSRLQEAQRLGRILRRGTSSKSGNNAFFYTLISTDTKEVYFSNKRRRYLVDQGYAYKVLKADSLDVSLRGQGMSPSQRLAHLFSRARFMRSKDEQLKLLAELLSTDVTQLEEAEDREFTEEAPEALMRMVGDPSRRRAGASAGAVAGAAQRTVVDAAALSGATGLVYTEYATSGSSSTAATTAQRPATLSARVPGPAPPKSGAGASALDRFQ